MRIRRAARLALLCSGARCLTLAQSDLKLALRAYLEPSSFFSARHLASVIQSCCLQIWVVVAGKAVRCRHCPATVMRNEADHIATASKGGKASA